MEKFEQFIQENPMIKSGFLAVLTKNPDEAIESYLRKTGIEPTILLVRPDFVPVKDHILLTRSRHAAWGLILVSHLVKPSEINDDSDLSSIFRDREGSEVHVMKNADFSFPPQKTGRPGHPKAICPHCHGKIMDFDSLGYWYGWSFGITPPYWEELRQYVFKRDNYTCQGCHKKYPPAFLQAHHINRKEDGGEDGARNLQTLCGECHKDSKPIFED